MLPPSPLFEPGLAPPLLSLVPLPSVLLPPAVPGVLFVGGGVVSICAGVLFGFVDADAVDVGGDGVGGGVGAASHVARSVMLSPPLRVSP